MWGTTQFDPSGELQDLKGKVVVVTGANQGIGYATVKHLARQGGKIYLGARSEEKGRKAVEQLQHAGIGPGEVIYFPCDLSSPSLAKESAEGFLQLEKRLDVLVNNAACIFDYETQASHDGITQMMMVNHFGTSQFTRTLLPLLLRTAEDRDSDVRIVTVASERHRTALLGANAKTAFKSLDECKNMYSSDRMATLSRYSLSKLANVLFSNTLHHKFHAHNIIALSVHPGVVATTTFTSHLPFGRAIQFLFARLFKGPNEGAYSSCWAAASPVVRVSPDKYGGSYVAPIGRIIEPAPNALDVEMQDDLWEMTERYLSSVNL